MKNQRKKTEARNFRLSKVAIAAFLLVAMLCCFTVLASAQEPVTVGIADLVVDLSYDNGVPYKEYDGTDDAAVSLTPTAQAKLDDLIDADDRDLVKVVVDAKYNSAEVAEATNILVSFNVEKLADTAEAEVLVNKYQSMMPVAISINAKIAPVTLEWNYGNSENAVIVDTTYVPGQTVYTVSLNSEKLPALNLTGAPALSSTALAATVGGVAAPTETASYTTTVQVGLQSANYVAAPLNVIVRVSPIEITQIVWENYAAYSQYVFAWGDAGINDIRVSGVAGSVTYPLNITFPEGYGEASTTSYLIKAEAPDGFYFTDNLNVTQTVTINKKVYEVGMESASFIGNAGIQSTPSVFSLSVSGDIPAEIRALITYTNNAQSEYGLYDVTATLPANNNYEFRQNGQVVTTLTAKLCVNRQYLAAANVDLPYQVILVGQDGFSADIKAEVVIPEQINRRAVGAFKYYKAYQLTVSGAAGETFSAVIPISDELFNKRCEALTADDIYVYEDATAQMIPAGEKSGYTVTLCDGYYQVDGVAGEGSVIFVLAPVYNAPFWATAWGIMLLVLLAVALIALLILIGLYLKRVRLSEENEVLVIDTEGEVPEIVVPVIEDKVDVDEAIDAELTQIAESIEPEDEVAEEAGSAETEAAVSEAMDELMEEVAAIELEKEEEEVVEETDPTETLAEEKAKALCDVAAEENAEAEADEDALRAAVAEALAENFNESADATEAIALVDAEEVEEEEDEITPEEFRAVVDAIVSDAMCNTMELPEELLEEETAEEPTEETESAEETAEVAEAVEETAEVVEETVEEVAEETTEAAAEETEEAVEETAEPAAEEVEETVEESAETAEEVAEETAEPAEKIVVEEMSNDDVCAVVADSVAEAFDLITVDGVTPKAVEGTTIETITEAVNNAAEANVPETWTAEMTDAVKEAVVDELAARLLVEEVVEEPVEEAVEAFAEVAEEAQSENEDDDDDNDNDDDEDDSFGGFGSMPLDFIDAVAEADKYAEMLEQERRGEVQLVTRYRRSFQSRLTQSQGNVQEYYNILKNALLSYKGVKNRISWNYEAFNRGRIHVAKMNAKTKTLYLYLALDPEELADTKYGIVDMSSKKKYATVPVLMKIKGERKFKYALELINKLCGENLELPRLETEPVDYKLPYQTTEEMVQTGLVKKLVASVPVVYAEAPVTEEPAEAVCPATEDQEVTFIAPTDDPAVVAAAEEVAVEEAVEVTAEAPAEEPAKEAVAKTPAEDENKEV